MPGQPYAAQDDWRVVLDIAAGHTAFAVTDVDPDRPLVVEVSEEGYAGVASVGVAPGGRAELEVRVTAPAHLDLRSEQPWAFDGFVLRTRRPGGVWDEPLNFGGVAGKKQLFRWPMHPGPIEWQVYLPTRGATNAGGPRLLEGAANLRAGRRLGALARRRSRPTVALATDFREETASLGDPTVPGGPSLRPPRCGGHFARRVPMMNARTVAALCLGLALAGCDSSDNDTLEIDPAALDGALVIQDASKLQLRWATLKLPPRGDLSQWMMTPEEFAAAMDAAREAARKRCMRSVYGTDDPRELREAIRTGEWGADSLDALKAYVECLKNAGFPIPEFGSGS